MQTDAAERGVGDGGAAEGEFEGGELGAAEGEDFGCGVGESAAEGLVVVNTHFTKVSSKMKSGAYQIQLSQPFSSIG